MPHFLVNFQTMPSFRVHTGVSGVVGMTGALWGMSALNWGPDAALAAGLAGWAGGLVPDLDAAAGRPVRLAAGAVSLAAALGALYFLEDLGTPPKLTAELILGLLLVFNTLGVYLFKRLTTHRGMFHSLPAALTYAAALAAAFGPLVGPALVGLAGVLSHLVLDSLMSVSLKPLKLWSGKTVADRRAWMICGGAFGLAAWRFLYSNAVF
ncbi:MAG: metal-dependent hydrolase [Pseudomonadota bacterium]